MVATLALVGLIPVKETRRYLNDLAFKISFRIICRSLSAVVTIHNKEYRPKHCGFCVANHTTPIDIAILSTDCSFSLVRIGFKFLKRNTVTMFVGGSKNIVNVVKSLSYLHCEMSLANNDTKNSCRATYSI